MPYYRDWYPSDVPFDNQPSFYQQPQIPNPVPHSHVQVVVPPRQISSPQQPLPAVRSVQHPVQQQQDYPRFATTAAYQPDPHQTQYYTHQNHNTYAYNQQQAYQPPPQPRVIVPPSPSQTHEANQHGIPRYSSQPPTAARNPFTPTVMPQKPQTAQDRALKVTKPNTLKVHGAAKPQTVDDSKLPTTQYPSLLLNLADEYLDASRKLEHRSREYYKLISTALGCMEAALKNFKLPSLREAQLSLRYGQLLYDETNNLDDAETILTKSTDLCERMKFVDLKYATQLLLAKVLFRSKPKAAMRDLHGMIQDLETYRHTAWEYPFRFQAVFFATDASDHDNLHEALHQLEKIQHVAKMNNDHAIYAYAAILESLLHLHSANPDAVSNSQRAMAKARSLQLNPDVEHHNQMPALMEIIDLLWSMSTMNEGEVEQKRKNLKETLYEKSIDRPWTTDELSWIRVNSASLKNIPIQEGGLIQEVENKHYIILSWLNKKELEVIGFLLMGVSIAQQNHVQRGKAERFSTEGYLITKEDIIDQPGRLSARDQKVTRRCHLLAMHFKIEGVFLYCSAGKWGKAQESLKDVKVHLRKVKNPPIEFVSLVDYVSGCIQQGTGNLAEALNHFQSKSLVLQAKQANHPTVNKPQGHHGNPTVDQLRILAAVNTALMVRDPSHPQHQHLRPLVDAIGSHVGPHSTPLVSAAHALLLSTLPNTTVLQMKQLLSSSLDFAKYIHNNQIISLTLTLMQDKFFRGGVQDGQAVKCAKAAAHQVKTRWGSPLWTAVSGMLEIESLMLQQDLGKQEDIARKKADVARAWSGLPEGVTRVMGST